MITRNFKLFLNAGKQIPLMINVSQYDHGEKWVFTLYDDNGQKYTPSTGAIVGIKADKKGIINTGTVNSAGQVEIMETQQMTAAAGKAVFELLIDGDTHGTANFIVLVEPKPGDQADMSTSDLSLLQQAINSITIAGSGAPAVATLAADMTDEGKIYLYAGSEVGYTAGDWYYYNGASWVDGGKYGGTVDATLTQPGQAADAKKVGDEISDLKSQLTNGIPYAVKVALNHIIQNVAFKNDTDYSADKATINTWATSINVTSINVVYEQSGTVYTTDSLDVLRDDLTVTAYYDNGTNAVVNDYTLSGELTEGESTIVVAYGGKASSITVTVTVGLPTGYQAYDYVANTDKTGAQNLNALIDTATYSDWNTLTIEWTAALLSTMSAANASIGGYRPATAWEDGKAIYLLKDGAGALACSHGAKVGDNDAGVGGNFSTNVPHVFKIIEASQSPSKFQIDDGTPVDIAWANTNTINGKAQFFRNVATNASNWYTNSFVQLGTLVIKDLNGDVVGNYVPCKRTSDNVIGFYDTIADEFHTARTVTYATVGHSNCMYSVGSWS